MTEELRHLFERTVVALERIADGLTSKTTPGPKPSSPRQYIGQTQGEPANGQADQGSRRQANRR